VVSGASYSYERSNPGYLGNEELLLGDVTLPEPSAESYALRLRLIRK
jgi:hypothetical protein